MKIISKTLIAATLFIGIGTLAGCNTQVKTADENLTQPTEKQLLDWSYSGKTGPANWGDIKPAYTISKTGKEQSPINIDPKAAQTNTKMSAITYQYQPTSFQLIRTDKLVQATAQTAKGRPDSTITTGGKVYTLKTINIHTPAEHTIDKQQAVAEIQLVHKSKDNKTVIVSVFLKKGAENKALGDLTSAIASSPNNKEVPLKTTISTLGLLPTNEEHFTYQGSYTTPPTTEGITWFVYRTAISISNKQLEQLKSKLANNNRPVQKQNERVIYQN